jgi:hypothetical protein
VARRKTPCYLIAFDFSNRVATAARFLFRLSEYLEFKNFNIFLHANRAFFIPRRNIETPTGFDGHRFGGLEMIGYFVMKSAESLMTADPAKLIGGIREIAFGPEEQREFEKKLSGFFAEGGD